MKFDITFHPSWWHKNAGVCFTEDFFNNSDYRIECDVEMRKVLFEKFGAYGLGEKDPAKRPILGTDFIAAGYIFSQMFGCEIKYQKDNSPQVICMDLTEDDIERINEIDFGTNLIWKAVETQISYLYKKYNNVEPCINLMGVQNIALDILGENLLAGYYTEPELIHSLLQKITNCLIYAGKHLYKFSNDVSGGVTAITRQIQPYVYLTSNCSVEMVSNEIYENFLLQYDTQLANEFNDFGIHHCGQTMEHVKNGYMKVPFLKFLEVGAGSDIKQIREAFPKTWLNARYSPVLLKNNSAADIEQNVKMMYEDGNNNLNQFSISCVGIDAETPDEQVELFLSACKSSCKNKP